MDWARDGTQLASLRLSLSLVKAVDGTATVRHRQHGAHNEL